jgi:tRNA U38,U39,U40 pseudouridine synthase TruA
MKAAIAYERRGQLLVHSSSRTDAGVWVLSQPVMAVDVENELDIGESVRKCLENSKIGIKHPESFSGAFSPILKLARARSYRDFSSGAKCVEIFEEGGVVNFFSTRNHGVDEGFTQFGVILEVPYAEPDLKFGRALLEALKNSE